MNALLPLVKKIFSPPTFAEDERKNRTASLLNTMLWSLAAAMLLLIIGGLLGGNTPLIGYIIIAIVFFSLLGLQIPMRLGKVNVSSIFLIICISAGVTSYIAVSGTIRQPGVVYYVLASVMAGLLISRSAAVISAIINSMIVFILLYAETHGALPPPETSTTITQGIGFAVGAFMTVVLLNLATHSIDESLALAHAELVEREHAEKALRDSEERYRLISAVSSDYMFSSLLNDQGKLTLNWVAGAFESITGYTVAEYIARGGWTANLHPEDIEQDAHDFAVLQANRPVISEVRTLTKNNEVRWVRIYAHPVWDTKLDQLVGVNGAVQDITERKITETALNQRTDQLVRLADISRLISTLQNLENVFESIYKKVQEALPLNALFISLYDAETNELSYPFTIDNGIKIKEPNSQKRSGTYLDRCINNREPILINHTAEKLRELNEAAAKKQGNFIGLPKPSASLMFAPMIVQSKVIGVMSVQSYILNAFDENSLTFLSNIALQSAIAIENARLYEALQRELKERTRTEDEARRLEELYRRAIEAADAVPYYLDFRTHTYTFMGTDIQKITGYTAEEMNPPLFLSLIKENFPRGAMGHLTHEEADRLTEAGIIRHWECDYRIVTRTGQTRWVSDSCIQVRDAQDQRIGVIGILQDITDRKQAEASLKKTTSRLEVLHEIDRALLSAQSPEEIARDALSRIRQLIPSQRTSITLFDFQKNEAIFLVASYDGNYNPADQSVVTIQEFGQYIIDDLLQNKACRVDDVLTDPRTNELDKQLAQVGFRAWLYLPLLYQGQLIGALNIGRATEAPFTTEETEIALGFANQLAIVIQQTRLYEALQNELTKRERTQEKLVNSEARLRALMENSPDLILEVDRQGDILFINRNTEIYLGTNIRKFLLPDQITPALEIIDKAFESGEFQTTELQTITLGGQTTWDSIRIGPVKQGHQVTSLTIIMTDITIQKQAEVALRRSETIYRQAITTAGAVPYYRDHRTNTYTFMGEGILAMTGYSASEMTPELWETLEQEGFPRGALAHLTYKEADRVTEEDATLLWECDYRIRTRDGQTRWVADTSVKGYNEYGERVGVIGILQDITERKQAEAERELFIKELEAKNAELERFNYTVSHELKSPIVTIKGFLGSIAKDLQDGRHERAQKDLIRISSATDKMYDTLSDLLELSRIGRLANPPEEIDLVQLAQDALETVHGRIQSSNITVQVSSELPTVYGDRIRLREVYENLIDNAAKHIGDQTAPLIEIGIRENSGAITLFVKDNGVGIDPRYHQRIFGLFDKLDSTSEGTGIGLALVKRIVETHGGRIWVESEGPGKGSTFCFTIPDSEKNRQ